MDAAVADLQAASPRQRADRATALSVDCRADHAGSAVVVEVTGAAPAPYRVTIDGAVVERAFDRKAPPEDLLARALAAGTLTMETFEDSKRSPRIGSGDPPPPEVFDQYAARYRPTVADRDAQRALQDGRDVILLGPNGSGKTLIAAARARACQLNGYGLIWLDLTDPADGPESIYATLLRMRRRERYLLVVDNVQRNAPMFSAIDSCVRRLRRELGLTVTVLATGWRAVVERFRGQFAGLSRVQVSGAQLIDLLIGPDVPDEARTRLKRLARGDVHIAAVALRLYAEHRQLPDRAELQEWFSRDIKDDPRWRKAMYWFACLGAFDIGVTRDAAEQQCGREVVTDLLDRRLIRCDDACLGIGHRERSRLILRHALRRWEASRVWGPPGLLVWQHVVTVGETLISAVLTQVDVLSVGEDRTDRFQEPTRHLAMAWDLVKRLEGRLCRDCAEDPSWGDNAGAAVFAAMAMVAINRADDWRRIAEYLRGRWRYDVPGALPAPNGESTGERSDFDKIFIEMAQEEQQALGAPAYGEPAGEIDLDRFHRTWMLGMLLSFEGTALPQDQDQARLDALLATAAAVQDPTEGWFYPRRVPWVTARVVLGLCHAGQTYGSSEAVRRACDWLRQKVSQGGPFDESRWRSGTGDWNRQEATTAMCVTALLRAEAPPEAEERTVKPAVSWLYAQEREWKQPGREIDFALVVEALLLYGGANRGRYPQINELLRWAVATPETDPVPEAELRVPFVAAQLAEVVWSTLRREFEYLLEDLINDIGRDDPAARHDHPGGMSEPGAAPETGSGGAEADSGAAPETGSGGDSAVPAQSSDTVLAKIDVGRWRKALRLLRNDLEEQLRAMQPVIDRYHNEAKNVYTHNEKLLGYRKRCESVTRGLAKRMPVTVLREIDSIGVEVCRGRWPAPGWREADQ